MNALELYLVGYEQFRQGSSRLSDLDDGLWRRRPHGLNSIAWLVWHVARFEDVAVNRFVGDQPQGLDDPTARWPERMRAPWRHWGTFMTPAQVAGLSET